MSRSTMRILFLNEGSLIGRVIELFTGETMSHVVVALDDTLIEFHARKGIQLADYREYLWAYLAEHEILGALELEVDAESVLRSLQEEGYQIGQRLQRFRTIIDFFFRAKNEPLNCVTLARVSLRGAGIDTPRLKTPERLYRHLQENSHGKPIRFAESSSTA